MGKFFQKAFLVTEVRSDDGVKQKGSKEVRTLVVWIYIQECDLTGFVFDTLLELPWEEVEKTAIDKL